MSSEQVIAASVLTQCARKIEAYQEAYGREYVGGQEASSLLRDIRNTIDRLSTPAAGGDDVPEYSQGVMGDGAAILRDGVPMTVDDIVGTLNQLQARNAEQADMLGACYVKAGADTDGDPPERHASDALRAVTDLRNDYDEACEELHGTNGWKPRAEAAESKLTALLDGIEGLEKELRDEFFATRVVAFFVTKLKALREKANGSQTAEQGGRGAADEAAMDLLRRMVQFAGGKRAPMWMPQRFLDECREYVSGRGARDA